MNTARSVAYGWGVLVVAAGVSYYYAKQDIDKRWKEQARKGVRPTSEAVTWQDKVKEYEAASNRPPPSAADSTTQASDAKSLSSETYRATRLESTPLEKGAHGVPQRAMPTGVDTTDSAAGARSER